MNPGRAPGDGHLKIYDETVETLARHLSGEIECLEALLVLLDREAAALRALSLEELDVIALQKEKAVSRQAMMAHRRIEILTAAGAIREPIETLSQLVKLAELEDEHPLVAQIERLRDLAGRIVDRNHRNHVFAQSGNGLVSALVQLIDAYRSPRARTYARNGHLRRHLLDSTPRRESVCSA